MGITDIDWSKNCMTAGVHNGDGGHAFRTSLSEIHLSDGAIYKMVETKVKEDAQQFVDHADFTQEFADLICELWEQYFEGALKSAHDNAKRYADALKRGDMAAASPEKREGQPNSSWNDHVTYICRVCGTSASRKASSVLEAEGKSIRKGE